MTGVHDADSFSRICSIKYGSDEDYIFKSHWLSCTEEICNFWAHAACWYFIGILSDNFNTNTNDSSNETMEAFIERRYEDIQNVHRKDEITSLKHILTEYINTEIKKVAEKTFKCCLHKDDSEKRILIETLTEEIRFLRKEIENKHFIIHNILSTKPTMHDKVDSLQNLLNVTNLQSWPKLNGIS